MNAPRLAIDLDGVLTEHPLPLARAANRAFDLNLPDPAFVDSAGINVPRHVREWVYSLDGPALDLRPAEGAREFLALMIEEFGPDSIRILTARPACSRETTEAWLARHNFPPVDVVYAEDKLAVACSTGITHAVEDSTRHAGEYVRHGIRCLLISELVPQPDDPCRLIRVANLDDAYRRLRAARCERRTAQLNSGGDRTSSVMNLTDVEAEQMAEPRYCIVVSDIIDGRARRLLGGECQIIDVDGTDARQLKAALRDADALIVRSETLVTRDVLEAGPKLRIVARAGVGVDNIDVESATELGILVLNAPGANAISAAEHTIALLLAVSRSLPESNASTHAGRWERKRFKPFDLAGKTVGIVGLGRVGGAVAQRLRGFDVDLIGYDPYISRERFEHLHVEPVSYEELLARADIVTFHAPATLETVDMLDAETIQRLKPGAIVLNCARGEIVDDHALAAALRSGQVRAAGIDVFSDEPAYQSPLFGLPNAVLTPHIGGSSDEALAKVGDMIGRTVLAALRGQAVPNAVNLPPASLNAPDLQRLTHIAGAAGHLLAVLQPHQPRTLFMTVNGVVPHDVTEHVTVAVLSVALERWTERKVTPVNARLVADEIGLEVATVAFDADPERVPEFTFAVNGDNPHRVTVRWDRRDAGILEVDHFTLERPLSGDVLITHHHDRPGIVGRVGMILGEHQINIAGMQVGRHDRGGEAIMVLNVDDPLPEQVLAEIRAISEVQNAYVVSLPAPLPPATRIAGAGVFHAAD
jgi:D-3-phosphoglycerate dehydrogenase / 2-oxoglutarate reductase